MAGFTKLAISSAMAKMRASVLELSGTKVVRPQAGIAQSVEQLIRNEKVVGSIPISGTIFMR